MPKYLLKFWSDYCGTDSAEVVEVSEDESIEQIAQDWGYDQAIELLDEDERDDDSWHVDIEFLD